jgi:hypothetical protein
VNLPPGRSNVDVGVRGQSIHTDEVVDQAHVDDRAVACDPTRVQRRRRIRIDVELHLEYVARTSGRALEVVRAGIAVGGDQVQVVLFWPRERRAKLGKELLALLRQPRHIERELIRPFEILRSAQSHVQRDQPMYRHIHVDRHSVRAQLGAVRGNAREDVRG